MTITDQINRLSGAKAAIKQSIENKGVEVSDTALLDEYPALIDSIEAGGGEGGDSYYEDLFNKITGNNTDYSYLFSTSGGTSHLLTELDLSSFDTSNVINMSYMFYFCSKLTTLDVSNFDTSNVTDMSNMFSYCESLTTLDVSNFDTSKVTKMNYMFQNCRNLTSIEGLNNWDISKVTNVDYMFNYSGLTSLDVSNWDVGHITSYSAILSTFNNCPALVDFQAPKNINNNISFNYSTALSHDSLMSIINNLATVTSTKTLTLGATNLAKLTDDEKAIATGKGWTVK